MPIVDINDLKIDQNSTLKQQQLNTFHQRRSKLHGFLQTQVHCNTSIHNANNTVFS